MNRRGFLGAMLAAAVAPAVVKSGVLMPVRPIWTPPVWMGMDFGVEDFTAQAYFDGAQWQEHMLDALRYGVGAVRILPDARVERVRPWELLIKPDGQPVDPAVLVHRLQTEELILHTRIKFV